MPEVTRNTKETQIEMRIDFCGDESSIHSGVPFLDHMLHQVAAHGGIQIHLRVKGDIEIDDHHTVEDVGIALGQCLKRVQQEQGVSNRFAHEYICLDESLVRLVTDASGRPYLHHNFNFKPSPSFEYDLIIEFYRAVVNHAMINLHIDVLRGENNHHIAEASFKAFGRCISHLFDLSHNHKISTKGML